MNVGDLGEFQLIEKLKNKFPVSKHVLLGSGDDAAVVSMPDEDVVISSDIAIEGVHFRLDWSQGSEIGVKIAAANLADICAMGAYPVALTVSLGLPANTPVNWVEQLTAGIATECARAKATVVGGDISRSAQIVVAITAIGQRRNQTVVTRYAAQVGDQVAISGELGWAAAGLSCLVRGQLGPREAVDRFRAPSPDYAAAWRAAKADATAMIDVSDGLLADLGHIAEASEVNIELSSAKLVPAAFLKKLGRNLGIDPMVWVLTGGEDHVFAATFDARRRLPAGFTKIGEVVAGSGEVRVDGEISNLKPGHDHFRTN
jgi:thiamine-monophosphate kinase